MHLEPVRRHARAERAARARPQTLEEHAMAGGLLFQQIKFNFAALSGDVIAIIWIGMMRL